MAAAAARYDRLRGLLVHWEGEVRDRRAALRRAEQRLAELRREIEMLDEAASGRE
jgi:hypothetical protein